MWCSSLTGGRGTFPTCGLLLPQPDDQNNGSSAVMPLAAWVRGSHHEREERRRRETRLNVIKLTRFHAARRCWPSGFARTKDEDGSRQQVPFSPCPTRPGWAGRLDHWLSRPLREIRRLKVITLFLVLVGNTLLVSLEMSLKSLLVHGSDESVNQTGWFAKLSSVVESSRYRWSSSLGSHLGRVS